MGSALSMALIVVIVAASTYRLNEKRRRGETVRYDGDERVVTGWDVGISAAFWLLLVAACVFQWWSTR